MRKLKAFYYVLKNSAIDPKYYADILKTKFRFTIKYLVLLAFFSAVLTSISGTLRMSPQAKSDLKGFFERTGQLYPEDLVISFKGGVWSINRDEPFLISMPKIEGLDFDNLVVFDKKGTIEDIKTLKSLVLFNDTNVIVTEADGSYTVNPLANIPDAEINREKVNTALNSLSSLSRFVPYFIFFSILLSMFAFYAFLRPVMLLAFAVILWLVSMIVKSNLKYVDCYRILLHAMTLPIIFQTLINITNIPVPFSGWFGIMNVIMALIVFKTIAGTKSVEEAN